MTAPSRSGDFIDRLWSFNDWVLHRLPGGANRCRPRDAINMHKLSVGPLFLLVMLVTDATSPVAWLYLVLHGLYGVFWVAKDVAFGDPSWTNRCSVSSAIAVFLWPLAGYYVAPLLIITDLGEAIPGGWGVRGELSVGIMTASVALFAVGVFFHFVSDCQKFFVLKYQQPRELIVDGMFALTRNPNYFGEILIYSAFNVLAQHWLPWVICATIWLQLFAVNMIRKDRSMARYPNHAAWAKRTGLLIPNPVGVLRSLPNIFGSPTQD